MYYHDAIVEHKWILKFNVFLLRYTMFFSNITICDISYNLCIVIVLDCSMDIKHYLFNT